MKRHLRALAASGLFLLLAIASYALVRAYPLETMAALGGLWVVVLGYSVTE